MTPITGLVWDPICKRHAPGAGHPERPERLDAALEGARRAAPDERLRRLPPRRAAEEDLLLCHDAGHVAGVREDILGGASCLSTGDTDVCAKTLDAAMCAAGGVLQAVDAVMGGAARNAFCAVRPPGHHASRSCSMGFCVFNNLAIGVRHAQLRHGVERVLVVDWDVHHGNGTQDIFYDDPTVFFFSTHQWPWYPGTGRAAETGSGAGKGFTLNCPYPSGSGRAEVLGAFEQRLVPAMRSFRPAFVFVSAGFDSREGDRLGHFHLTDRDFADLSGIVMEIADEYAGGRLVSVLEGGYELDGLASACGAHVARLAGLREGLR